MIETIKLTPNQERLIAEAKLRDRQRILFFGIPEKTKQKLIDAGIVKTVLDVERESEEYISIRKQIHENRAIFDIFVDNEDWVNASRAARTLSNLINKMNHTITVVA